MNEPHWIDWGTVSDYTNICAYECSVCHATFYSHEVGNRCMNCKTPISKVVKAWNEPKENDNEKEES